VVLHACEKEIVGWYGIIRLLSIITASINAIRHNSLSKSSPIILPFGSAALLNFPYYPAWREYVPLANIYAGLNG
jgi:hypothetical protein